MIVDYAREALKQDIDLNSLARAREEISDMVARAMGEKRSRIQTRQRAARGACVMEGVRVFTDWPFQFWQFLDRTVGRHRLKGMRTRPVGSKFSDLGWALIHGIPGSEGNFLREAVALCRQRPWAEAELRAKRRLAAMSPEEREEMVRFELG